MNVYIHIYIYIGRLPPSELQEKKGLGPVKQKNTAQKLAANLKNTNDE